MDRLKYYALTIENEAKVAEGRLMDALRQSNVLSKCYAYRSRVKPEEKLIEKVKRKKKEKPYYELKDITDVIGIRLVMLFRDQMPYIFNDLLSIILHNDKLSPNPFKVGHIEEIIAYTTSHYDEVAIQIKQIVDSKDVGIKFEHIISKERYSSIHIVTRLDYIIQKLNGYHINTDYHIPVEIQIRTVFEDAWGEIDHKYGYVKREGKDAGVSIANADIVQKHLKILKRFADACAEYADAIHYEAIPSRNKFDAVNVLSVSKNELTADYFASIGIAKELVGEYRRATEVKTEGLREKSNNAIEATKLFLLAADGFNDLSKKYDGADLSVADQKDQVFYFYLRMNAAICLLSTNQVDKIREALSIYRELESIYTGFPLLKMRTGQAYGKLGFPDTSIEKYLEAAKEIDEFEASGLNFSEKLPKSDYEHMKKFLPRLHGYQLWKKFCSIDVSTEGEVRDKLKLMENAYNVTSAAIVHESGDGLVKIHNNMLYYAVEYLNLVDGYESLAIEGFQPKLSDHLGIIVANLDLENTNDIETLDTIAKAYNRLGESEKKMPIIDRIIKLTLDQNVSAGIDKEIMLSIAQEAYAMKQRSLKSEQE